MVYFTSDAASVVVILPEEKGGDDYPTYHPEGFRFPLNLVGSDRIVVGTDSFNARDIEYPSAVVEQFKLPAVDRDRILKGNAIRLFRL